MRNVARKEATQNETAKGKAAKKRCTSGGASKSCTFVFNFRQRSLKPNQSTRAGGPNWHETCSYPPTSPRSAVLYNNIFFHRQRACLIAPFIREEARLRSASLPPVPTAVAVCLRHHTLCSLARGTRKLGARGLRCGIKRQIGPRFFHPKGHIMFRGWLSSTKPGSLLINKTSRLFALIPQAAHMQESAAQGKIFQEVISSCLQRRGPGKKIPNSFCFYSSPHWFFYKRTDLAGKFGFPPLTMKEKNTT